MNPNCTVHQYLIFSSQSCALLMFHVLKKMHWFAGRIKWAWWQGVNSFSECYVPCTQTTTRGISSQQHVVSNDLSGDSLLATITDLIYYLLICATKASVHMSSRIRLNFVYISFKKAHGFPVESQYLFIIVSKGQIHRSLSSNEYAWWRCILSRFLIFMYF